MANGENFANTFKTTLSGIGGGIAGFINPLIGGKTTNTETTTPKESTGKTTAIVVIAAIVLLAGVLYFSTQSKSKITE